MANPVDEVRQDKVVQAAIFLLRSCGRKPTATLVTAVLRVAATSDGCRRSNVCASMRRVFAKLEASKSTGTNFEHAGNQKNLGNRSGTEAELSGNQSGTDFKHAGNRAGTDAEPSRNITRATRHKDIKTLEETSSSPARAHNPSSNDDVGLEVGEGMGVDSAGDDAVLAAKPNDASGAPACDPCEEGTNEEFIATINAIFRQHFPAAEPLSDSMARHWLKQFSRKRILQAVDAVKKMPKVTSPVGYVESCLANGYEPKPGKSGSNRVQRDRARVAW